MLFVCNSAQTSANAADSAYELIYVSEINECDNDPCYPFGDCVDLIGDYECQCKTGYEAVINTTKLCKGTMLPGSITFNIIMFDCTSKLLRSVRCPALSF
jgi:hypothetical protein